MEVCVVCGARAEEAVVLAFPAHRRLVCLECSQPEATRCRAQGLEVVGITDAR